MDSTCTAVSTDHPVSNGVASCGVPAYRSASEKDSRLPRTRQKRLQPEYATINEESEKDFGNNFRGF